MWNFLLQLDQTMKTKMSMEELEKSFLRFDDLENLTPTTNIQNVETALVRIFDYHHWQCLGNLSRVVDTINVSLRP